MHIAVALGVLRVADEWPALISVMSLNAEQAFHSRRAHATFL